MTKKAMIHNFWTTSPFLSLTKVELVAPLRVKTLSVCMKKNSKEIVSISSWCRFKLTGVNCITIIITNLTINTLLSPLLLFTITNVFFITIVNPWNPKSDKHLISPYNISPESHVKVMRIKEMITNQRGFWLVNKISLSAP